MSKKIYILILSLVFINTCKIKAQDFRFSQYTEVPQLVNPALTGASAIFKASVIYRDQWRTVTVPYKTYGFSVESRFKTSSWEQVPGKSMTFTKKSFNRFAGGLSFYSDKAGDGNLRTTQFNVNLATFVPLSRESNLSIGFQGSVVQRKIDFSNLIFSNQYNGAGYDASMANGENSKSFSFIYPDLGAGINWNYTGSEKLIVANRQKKANVGLAIFHINRPQQTYLMSSTPKIGFKYVFHGDFVIGVPRTNIAFAPSFLAQLQNSNHEIVAGTAVKYYIKENSKYTGIIQRTSIGFGAYYRYRDAVIFSFSYDKKQQYGIGISYDMNISGLSKVSKLSGGPEITLRYNTGNAYLFQKKVNP